MYSLWFALFVHDNQLCQTVTHACSCTQGYDSTCGLLCRLNQPALEDSVVVEVLRRQGAIPFVKTNVPQSLMRLICTRPIGYMNTL